MADRLHCVLPFNHLHIAKHGAVQACCISRIKYGNINTSSYEEVWNNQEAQSIRSQFKAGRRHPKCANCYAIEDSGGRSLRQEYLERYPEVDVEDPKPTFFDIRFSNVCNFRCRTCWHGASSKWYKEAQLLGQTAGEKAILQNINNFDRFLEEVGPYLLKAQELYFAGGEPLYTDEHYRLLEYLIKHNASTPKLRYNTNASTLRHKDWNVIDLWSHFDSVEVMASIDALGPLGEYIRKEMNWNSTKNVLDRLAAIPHIQLTISPTVSILNVAEIPVLFDYCKNEGWITASGFYINLLHRPYHYNIQAIPRREKDSIAEIYLSKYEEDMPSSLRKSYQEIIDYMYGEDRSPLFEKFKQYNTTLDQLRSEHLPNQWWNQS